MSVAFNPHSAAEEENPSIIGYGVPQEKVYPVSRVKEIRGNIVERLLEL